MIEAMRRIALYGLGLLLASVLALTYATTSHAKAGGPVRHTCSVTDRAFIDTAKTNMAAITLWGQEYMNGDTGAADVAAQADRAAKIVGAAATTDPSLTQTRRLLVAMFVEYEKAMQRQAKHRDAGNHIYRSYALANLAHDVLVQAEAPLAKRGCDVAPLL
jgi:hypothetical protein